MKTKLMGIILIIIAIILFIIFISFTLQIQSNAAASCSCVTEGQECSMQGLPWQSYLGFSFTLILILLGIYLMFKKEEKEIKAKTSKKILNKLNKEEKKIYKLIVDAHGTIFQSELVEKSGFNKVKVTRILDKLEGKKIIERRRRGMTNVVILH